MPILGNDMKNHRLIITKYVNIQIKILISIIHPSKTLATTQISTKRKLSIKGQNIHMLKYYIVTKRTSNYMDNKKISQH